MYQNQFPIPRAYAALVNVNRGFLSDERGRAYALSWLAAARMVILGTVPGVRAVQDLANEDSWQRLSQAGLPIEDAGVASSEAKFGSASFTGLATSVEIVKALCDELGTDAWDVLPTVTAASFKSRYTHVDVAGSVAELMLDLLPVDGEQVWIPFDHSGVLTIRALRRGRRICAAPMLPMAGNELKLLLAIETGYPEHVDIETMVTRDAQGRPTTRAVHAIVNPPFGMTVRDSRLAQWASPSGRDDEFDRSESMVVFEVLKRVSGRAVFLVPQGVMFTGGQEQRLREFIAHRGGECNDLHSVIALPPGAVSTTNLSAAILSVGIMPDESVLMVDLGSAKRSAVDIDEVVNSSRTSILERSVEVGRIRSVSRQDVINNDCLLAPSRYLREKVDVGPNAVPLGQVCELIRPPAISKSELDDQYVEAGIPDLGSWLPLSGPFTKTVRVRSKGRELPTLQASDILLSVKGSLGKVGLMGDNTGDRVFPSQSCIGLRVKAGAKRGKVISPEYLLMYLRSESGQAQLDALRVGATVPHISISTLMEQVLIPIGGKHKQEMVEETYVRLCHFEGDIIASQASIADISREHWTLD